MISYIALPKTENLDFIMHIELPLFYLNHSHSYLLRNYGFLYAFYNMKKNGLLLTKLDVVFNFILLKPNLFLIYCFEKLYRREIKNVFKCSINYKNVVLISKQ